MYINFINFSQFIPVLIASSPQHWHPSGLLKIHSQGFSLSFAMTVCIFSNMKMILFILKSPSSPTVSTRLFCVAAVVAGTRGRGLTEGPPELIRAVDTNALSDSDSPCNTLFCGGCCSASCAQHCAHTLLLAADVTDSSHHSWLEVFSLVLLPCMPGLCLILFSVWFGYHFHTFAFSLSDFVFLTLFTPVKCNHVD